MKKIKCKMCMWVGTEDELKLCYNDMVSPPKPFKGCPNGCGTDAFLVELDNTSNDVPI